MIFTFIHIERVFLQLFEYKMIMKMYKILRQVTSIDDDCYCIEWSLLNVSSVII